MTCDFCLFDCFLLEGTQFPETETGYDLLQNRLIHLLFHEEEIPISSVRCTALMLAAWSLTIILKHRKKHVNACRGCSEPSHH